MPLYALTGGIAAGKSTVLARLDELGAHVLSADQIVRDVQAAGTPVLAAIEKRFGIGVIDAHGELDRSALARIIFGDALARRDLEEIVHPAVRAESTRRIDDFRAQHPGGVIVYDIPLLVESGRIAEFDAVIVLACPPEIRIDRLVRFRGMPEEEARSRVAAQASEHERLAVARWVIDTSGTLAETLDRTSALWSTLSGDARA